MAQIKHVKDTVRQHYTAVAQSGHCCNDEAGATTSDCNDNAGHLQELGYTPAALASLPEGAVAVGAGCGNPTALASLKPGETVLDLGSGGGIDALLAAQRVGPQGRVLGVDMTPAMLEKARKNAKAAGVENVEFLQGEIEHLPLEDAGVDVIISNCVINLSLDKDAVFAESHRVLKPGGRLLVSGLVTVGELDAATRQSAEAWAGCIAGALDREVYVEKLRNAGFKHVEVVQQSERLAGYPVVSISVGAVKPPA